MADNERHIGDCQHVARHLRAGMGEVQNHAARGDLGHQFGAELGQAPVADAVQRPASRVVEEMLQPDDAVACVLQRIEIGKVAFQRMAALDPQKRGGDILARLARLQNGVEPAARGHEAQRTL